MRVIANTDLLGQDLRAVPEPIQPEDSRMAMTEKELQAAIVELAAVLKYEVQHPYDSRKSRKGWPDLTIFGGRHNKLLFAELKTTKGKITQEQADTLRLLADCGQFVYVWRPYDWITGGIERILRGPRDRT